jgi:hypothetical protein
MANTTNFGWETPDDTDLVKDGAASIRTPGSAIDTSMMDLKGGTTGQVLSKNSNTDMDFTWVTSDDANAIQNAIVDAKGDLITATAADTPARLAVGTNGQYLSADSTETTGLKWVTPAASGGMTLLETLTLSGSSTTSSSIASTYKHLYVVCKQMTASGNTDAFLRFNSDTGSNYFRSQVQTEAPSSISGGGATAQTRIIVGSISSSTGAAQRMRGNFWIARYTDTDEIYVNTTFFSYEGVQKYRTVGAVYDNSAAISTITFGLDSGTFSSGTVYIYGVS